MANKIACEHCVFFAPEKGIEVAASGECRRNAPGRNWRVAEWPAVLKEDFCGEFVRAAE